MVGSRGVVAAAGFAVVCCITGVARAATGTWTGMADAYWTNSQNWSASPYPSGSDQALFGAGGSGQPVVDVAGLPSVSTLTFSPDAATAFAIGAGGAKAQTLVLEKKSLIKLESGCAYDQSIQANLQLGTVNFATTNTLQNDSTDRTLTLAGDIVFPPTGGVGYQKSLFFSGAGASLVTGDILKGAFTVVVFANGGSLLTLSGSNHVHAVRFEGVPRIVIDGYCFLENTTWYPLIANSSGELSGAGTLRIGPTTTDGLAWVYVADNKTLTVSMPIYSTGGLNLREGNGTLVLNGLNDIGGDIAISNACTLSVAVIGNRGSTDSNLGQGDRVIFNGNGSRLLYTGSGETSDRILELNNSAVIDHSGTGELIFSEDLAVGGTVKTLTLQGSASGTGELRGAIGAGSATTSLAKGGAGTWKLTAANTCAGSVAVNGGTLVLSGAAGSLAAAAGYTVSANAALTLQNTEAANHTDRLRDSAPIALNGGTLGFAHSGGAASYSESVGALTIVAGANTVAASQAAEGQTSVLTIASLAHTSGTLNFSGAGLGESDRNRIFITGQADGVIGRGATVNGTSLAAYSSTLGVYGVSEADYVDLAARGPDSDSIIPDNSAVLARINLPGTSGPMTLEGAWSNRVGLLLQNADVEAVVAMSDGVTNKSLLTAALQIAPDKAALTIGQSAGEGLLMPLAEGGDLLLANHATGVVLTVNAAITNNAAASTLTKSGAGQVTLAGPAGHTGATLLNEGALTLSSAADQMLPGVISGAGSLIKTGGGRLTLSGANTFAGELLVSTGTVVAAHSEALGPDGAGTVIAPGAALDVGGLPGDNSVRIINETITVSGAGTDGSGALINTGTGEQRYAFFNGARVRLAGDTTVGVTNKRFGFWPSAVSEMLELDGHTLTKIGSGMFSLVSTGVNPGAGHLDVQAGTLMLAYDTRLDGGETNMLTVRSGAMTQLYQAANPFSWTLALKDRSFVMALGSVPRNVWSGPVTLDGQAVMDGGNLASYSMLLSGPVSGTGSLVTDDPLTVYLTHTNNTFSGGAIVSNGVLTAASAGALPGYTTAGKYTVAPAGTLAILAGDGWSSAQIDALRGAATFVTTNAALGIDTSLGDWTDNSGFAQAFCLAKLGTNTLTLAGTTAVAAQLRAQAGTLNLAGAGTHTANSVQVTGGAATEMVISAPLTVANYGSLTCGAVTNDRCVLRITTNLTINSANTTLRGKLYAGFAGGAAGTVIQSGGHASISATSEISFSDGVSVGYNGGHGYYRMTGGKLSTWYMSVSGSLGNDNSVGVFDLMDGVVDVTGAYLNVGHMDGIGVLNLFGGSFATKLSRVYITQTGNRGTFGMINLLGPAATFDIATYLEMANMPNNKASVVNLNNGLLRLQYFSVSSNGTPAYVNFNGGTLQAKATRNDFLPTKMTAATVYPGGAVIDSAGFNITVVPPLLAPVGYGVTRIALTSGGSGYIGAPAVQISGGVGSNATAIALVDLEAGSPTCGRVTNIVVTSAGSGYASADKLTVTLHGGGYLTAATVGTVTKAVNTSGGLTKLGAGILTLSGASTYAGATVISNGTLKLGNAKALLKDAPVILAGGTLDLNGYTVTNTLGGTAGTVSNGTMVAMISPAGAGALGSETFTPGTATVKGTYLADVAADGGSDYLTIQGGYDLSRFSLELVNAALLNPEKAVYTLAKVNGTRTGTFGVTNLVLPDSRWHVLYSSDGTVKLVFANGTCLLLK